ncbi:TetR/AcrR family transcriptional regulator C-terminal domain-containing protein [Symbioplanes lichenis]|uniref:TetR/AcrR family transcriptional regulator C-terminal domain-containing protein n=1 Tax=Symbioplanes lichenis TaxID=1629072 RepID=UPI00273952E2|nr:TetR/AcrR family transcriptional regulator C-terminal domain-containing protein [Actinoplanes lichenis]
MSEPSEAPDLDRLLSLLWRRTAPPAPARTGRKPRLGLDDVIAAAMAIADADGLEAASMARVGERLGVATMTLYTYVPSRAALVDLMVDEALEQRHLATIGGGPAEWRRRLVDYAHRTREIYRLHPWLSQVSAARPPLGPGTFREREFVLAAMADAGLPLEQVNPAAVAFTTFVTAGARQVGESVLLRQATGKSTDAWWQERTSFWENWFDVEQHPTMTRVWEADGYGGGTEEQAAVAFDYGLQKILDGMAAG